MATAIVMTASPQKMTKPNGNQNCSSHKQTVACMTVALLLVVMTVVVVAVVEVVVVVLLLITI